MNPPDDDGPGPHPRAVESPPLVSDGPRRKPSTIASPCDLEAAREDVLRRAAGPPYIIVARDRSAQRGERTTAAWSLPTIDDAVDCAREWSEVGGDIYLIRNRVAGGQLYVRHHTEGCCRKSCACPRRPVDRGGLANPPHLIDMAAIAWLPIDIDPVDGVDPERGRAHALRLVEELARHVPVAVTMDSGRGVQSGIRVQPPVARDDDASWTATLSLARRVETWLRGRANADLVKVDSIANVNRFTRLTGFANTRTDRIATVITERDVAVCDPRVYLPMVISRAGARDAHRPRRTEGTAGCVNVGEWRNPHIAERLATLSCVLSPYQMALLRGLDDIESADCDPISLTSSYLVWASTGNPYAGRVNESTYLANEDTSGRLTHFAAVALSAGEPWRGIIGALLEPSFEVLNHHWLAKGLDPWRTATRAAVWAVAQVGAAL